LWWGQRAGQVGDRDVADVLELERELLARGELHQAEVARRRGRGQRALVAEAGERRSAVLSTDESETIRNVR